VLLYGRIGRPSSDESGDALRNIVASVREEKGQVNGIFFAWMG
jgi:hypothetical protein